MRPDVYDRLGFLEKLIGIEAIYEEILAHLSTDDLEYVVEVLVGGYLDENEYAAYVDKFGDE